MGAWELSGSESPDRGNDEVGNLLMGKRIQLRSQQDHTVGIHNANNLKVTGQTNQRIHLLGGQTDTGRTSDGAEW